MSWPFAPLGKLCDFMTGGTPSTKVKEYYEGGEIPWIASGDIHLGKIYGASKAITPLGMENSPAKFLSKNSVLIALNGQGKTRGTVALLRISGATCNQSVVAMTPKRTEVLDIEYLFAALKSQYMALRELTGDKNRAGLNMGILKRVNIPLPPLDEQKRIAKILDAADALRAKRRESIAQLDALLQSTFLDMFGDPFDGASVREVSTIGEIAQVGSGSTPSRKNARFFSGSVPWVKSTEVDWGIISSTSESVSAEGAKSARLRTYPEGSIVLALYGQGKTRGKCAILGLPATVNQACCVIVPNDEDAAMFLFHYLKLSYLRLRGESRGGNQENLNMQIIRTFPVPVANVKSMRSFSEIARSTARVLENFESQQRELDALFSSLQSRAFNGEL